MVVVVEKLVLVPRWLQVLVHLRLPVLVRETMWLSALALVFVLVLVLMVVVVLSTGVCVLGEQAHTYVNQAVAKLLTGISADPSLQTALDLNEMDTRRLDFFKRQAEQLVAANVTLIDEQQQMPMSSRL